MLKRSRLDRTDLSPAKPGAADSGPVDELPSVVKKERRSGLCRKGSAHARCPCERRPSRRGIPQTRDLAGGRRTSSTSTRPCSTRSDRGRVCGPIGSATVAKLVHNMSGYAIVCALAESFTLGEGGQWIRSPGSAGSPPRCGWTPIYLRRADRPIPAREYDPLHLHGSLLTRMHRLANALGGELGRPYAPLQSYARRNDRGPRTRMGRTRLARRGPAARNALVS